jgi:transcription antitermination factor NusG
MSSGIEIISLNEPQNWFVLQVVPRHEKAVSILLEQRNYGHFLPTCKIRRRWSDRIKVVEEPLFPGYVFCMSEGFSMELVRSTSGIVRVVTSRGKPCPVDEEEIKAIRRIAESGRDIERCPYLTTGLKVQVIGGPLSGITGVITQLKKRDRLVMSVDVIMQGISVDIDQSEVMLLQTPVAMASGF